MYEVTGKLWDALVVFAATHGKRVGKGDGELWLEGVEMSGQMYYRPIIYAHGTAIPMCEEFKCPRFLADYLDFAQYCKVKLDFAQYLQSVETEAETETERGA